MLKKTRAKIKTNKLFDRVNLSIFAVIFVVIGGYIVINSFAATPPAVYLNPASSSVAVNTDFTVEIRENSGTTAVNGVTAKISYPANLLDFVSIDTTNGAFKLFAEQTGASGAISVSAAAFDTTNSTSYTLTGDQLVATIHFKSKATAGAASVAFTSGTALVEAAGNTEILGGLSNTTGATYTVTAPANQTPSGSLYLSPATSSIASNTAFNVEVHESSGTAPVNGVTAKISYPANLLDFVSIDTTNGAFKLFADQTGANGNISISAAAFDTANSTSYTLTGDQLVATLHLKTKATAGAAALAFTSGTALIDSDTNTDILGSLSKTTGATYTVTVATPPSSGNGGSSGSGGGSTTPPSGGGSTTSGGGTTNKGTGSTKSTGSSTSSNSSSNTGSSSTTSSTSTSSSSDSSDDSQTSYLDDQSYSSQGYKVTIKVVNSKGKAVSGVKVKLSGQTQVTNKNGLAIFEDVLAGKQKVTIDGSSKPYSITVDANSAESQNGVEQQFTLKLDSGTPIWAYIIGGLALITIIVLAITWIGKGPKPGQSSGGTITPVEAKAIIMPTDTTKTT